MFKVLEVSVGRILEVSVGRILEVTAVFFLTSCALAERIGEDVLDGKKALTVVTAQQAVLPITNPILKSLDNIEYKINLVDKKVDNIAAHQVREDAKIAQIETALKELGIEVAQIKTVSKKILHLENKILKLNRKVKGISYGNRKQEGKIAIRRLNR